MIERAFIVENSTMITAGSLPDQFREPRATSSAPTTVTSPTGEKMTGVSYSGPLDFDAFKEEMEKEFIVSALKANNGRINQTVAQANIPKNTLLRKIRKYQIDVKSLTGASED